MHTQVDFQSHGEAAEGGRAGGRKGGRPVERESPERDIDFSEKSRRRDSYRGDIIYPRAVIFKIDIRERRARYVTNLNLEIHYRPRRGDTASARAAPARYPRRYPSRIVTGGRARAKSEKPRRREHVFKIESRGLSLGITYRTSSRVLHDYERGSAPDTPTPPVSRTYPG